METRFFVERILAVLTYGSMLSGCGGYDTTACFDLHPEEEDCPTDEDEIVARVRSEGHYDSRGNENCESIDGADEEPHRIGVQCCYEVDVSGPGLVGCGRPFLEGGRALTAPLDARGSAWSAHAPHVSLEGLSPELVERLGQAWARDALLEHASVASFARFSLELMALGAPAELVAAAHRAALDEVRHARACFALAEAYLGRRLAPGPIDMRGTVTVSPDPDDVASRVAREGCVGETLSAMLLSEQLRTATEPAVRRVLAFLVRDETRHAELAWRTLSWLTRNGASMPRLDPPPLPQDGEISRAHGRPDLRAAARAAWREVIAPCLLRLAT